MKRYAGIFAVLVLLGLPVVSAADDHGRSWDDQGWLPSWWTPTPPMGGTAGMTPGKPRVTPREQTRATQPQVVAPAQPQHGPSRETAREPAASSRSSD